MQNSDVLNVSSLNIINILCKGMYISCILFGMIFLDRAISLYSFRIVDKKERGIVYC